MKKTKIISLLLLFSFLSVVFTAVVATNVYTAVAEKEIGQRALPRVTHTFNGDVSTGTDSTQHSFTVPTGATLVEASISFASGSDFDFSMWDNQNRRTGGWTNADHSLKTDIPNSDYSGYSANPEWINVDPPATTGTWYVGCYAYSGSGAYTITVVITEPTVDTTPPTVSITAPGNGATVSGSITITASASDNVGVDYVACNIDGGTWTNDATSPYSWTLDTTSYVDLSSHTINCRAYDAAGNYADDSITITVDNSAPVEEEEWGITTTGFSSSSTHRMIRIMGGTSPTVDATVTHLNVRTSGSGTMTIALYTGGTVSSPTSAVLRTEAHNVPVVAGWNRIDVPDYVVAAGSVTWIAWAHSTGVYYSSSSADCGDFQSARGRWSVSSPSDYDETSSLPTNIGAGSFSNFWYAVHATYIAGEPPVDTTPPTVSLTAPSNGATVSDTITVSATASDNVGVDHVIFKVDGGTITTDSTSPYSTSLDTTTLSDGSHTITATAYDAAGNYDVDSVTVTVDNSGPVTNELTSGVPVTSSLSAVGDTEMWFIDVGADAEEMYAVLTCGTSDFDLYGRLGAEPTTSTYDWRGYTGGGEEVTTANPGAGIWYIMVRDYSGSGSYELTVTITYAGPDVIPPTINIGSPGDGSTVSSADVTVSWSGSDADSGIDYYEIQLDGGSWTNKGTSTSHSYTGLSETSHTVNVRAWDVAGNDATDSVTFTVDTSASQVTKYAVIVGISDYKAISDLSYCDEDASDWYNFLDGAQMNFDYLWVFGDGHTSNYPQYDGYATEYNIKQALNNMVSLADSDDIICFLTSGHGSGNGYGSSYICAWDCGSGESGEDGDFYDTELESILDGAVAEKIFVFIDHCYSGGFGPELMAMPNNDNVYLAVTCSDSGYGYDYPTGQNGAWTYFFLEVAWINHYGGTASTALETIFDYALANYPYGGDHTPEEYDGNSGQAFYLA